MRKRVLTLVLALTMCLGLCISALASETESIPTYDEAVAMVTLDVSPKMDKDKQYVSETLDVRPSTGGSLSDLNGYYSVPLDSEFEIRNSSTDDRCFIIAGWFLYENDGAGTFRPVEGWGGIVARNGAPLPLLPADSASLAVTSEEFAGKDLFLRVTYAIGFYGIYTEGGEPLAYYVNVDFRLNGADQNIPAQKPDIPEKSDTPTTPVTATPTASTVLVNGEKTAFDAYSINGNNYFKLRDLAYVLNGTDKQFEVGWDGDAKAISLTSGAAYTAVGGEMTGKGSGTQTATPSTAKIILDGTEISLTAYSIGGNNYFKLRDIGQTFDFGIGWDGGSRTITIDTSVPYTAE